MYKYIFKKNSDVKKVIEIYKSKGSIEALKSIPWTFNIILWYKKIDYNTNPVGFITNEGSMLMAESGMGLSDCKLLEIKDNNDFLLFIIEGEECVENKKYKDRAPDCLK